VYPQGNKERLNWDGKILKARMLTEGRLEKLGRIVQNKKVLILTHNNPDPDAISAGWALGYILRKKFRAACQLVYGGLIARAENRAMVRLLNIDIKPIDSVNFHDFEVFALVDTQPRAGNNSLPNHIRPSIIIDHHGARKSSQGVEFSDIRLHYGSSATILTEYLMQAGLAISKTMATALYYGIKTDTQNLGRHATEGDYNAAIALYPKVQLKILSRIEYPDLPRDYFIDFDRGLHHAKIYGRGIFCDLKFLTNTDMVALMADFFLRFSGISWSFVMGTNDSRIIFSLRTKHMHQNTGQMARRMVKGLGSAGGHGRTGGGQIPIHGFSSEKAEKMRQAIRKRFLKLVRQEKAAEQRLLPAATILPLPPSAGDSTPT
jgi:nanoRNase/pAp phosphatase (c-di-AMP/oligoRNAs hydrolase)